MLTARPAPEDTLSHIYQEHHGWLFQWLWRKLGCRTGAADMAHDAFVRVLAAGSFEAIREPRAYLSKVAHGLVANHWRHLALERDYLAALQAQPELLAPSPEEHALMMETLFRLDQMLSGLSQKARQIFLLAQLEGMAYAQIATHMAISERMVKKYMAQTMLHCALALESDCA